MADLLDILTLAEGQSAINSAAALAVTELEALITGVSGQIDELCGPVVARAVTEYHDGGNWWVILDTPPALSITSVAEYSRTGAATALTAEDHDTKPAAGYLLDGNEHRAKLLRRASGSSTPFLAGEQNVAITYQAGRYADTASVAGKFKAAAASILRYVWQQEAAAWQQRPQAFDDFEPGTTGFLSIPDLIRNRLPGELRGPLVA